MGAYKLKARREEEPPINMFASATLILFESQNAIGSKSTSTAQGRRLRFSYITGSDSESDNIPK